MAGGMYAWWGRVCVAGEHACVTGACMAGGACGSACMAGGVHGRGCVWWGHAWQEKAAIAVGNMHPTGMHSCSGMWSHKFCGKSINTTVIFRPIPKINRYIWADFYHRILNQIIFQVKENLNFL